MSFGAEKALAEAIIAFEKIHTIKSMLEKALFDIEYSQYSNDVETLGSKAVYVSPTTSEKKKIKIIKRKIQEVFYKFSVATWTVRKCRHQKDIEDGINDDYAKKNIEDCDKIIEDYECLFEKLSEANKAKRKAKQAKRKANKAKRKAN